MAAIPARARSRTDEHDARSPLRGSAPIVRRATCRAGRACCATRGAAPANVADRARHLPIDGARQQIVAEGAGDDARRPAARAPPREGRVAARALVGRRQRGAGRVKARRNRAVQPDERRDAGVVGRSFRRARRRRRETPELALRKRLRDLGGNAPVGTAPGDRRSAWRPAALRAAGAAAWRARAQGALARRTPRWWRPRRRRRAPACPASRPRSRARGRSPATAGRPPPARRGPRRE